jgi:prepilin-type N-terminal cleavage/methylation domain-containing protein
MSTSRRSTSRAFTLVEMLVVLGIIGVLIALLLPAIMAAVRNARNAAIALEITTLGQAIETYKQQRGEYPPCFGDYDMSGTLVYGNTMTRNNSAVERHLQRCYPKFTANKDAFYMRASDVDQAEVLPMWLSMISTEPGNPFDATATASRHGYYEFDQRRLVQNGDSDNIPIYHSRYTRETPYVYVENRNYGQLVQQNCAAKARLPDGTEQRMVPYGSGPMAAMNPTKFQILCAGQDGEWGDLPPVTMGRYQAKQFPAGINYFPGDRDNLANFSEGRTLGDARPQ